jgi:hypothetical protein
MLEFLDEVDLEFWINPQAEFESDNPLCIGTSVTSGGCFQTYGLSLINPLLDDYLVTVQSCLTLIMASSPGFRPGRQ